MGSAVADPGVLEAHGPPGPNFHLSHMKICTKTRTLAPPGPKHRVMAKNFAPCPHLNPGSATGRAVK